jgi:hypothetical protein
MVPINKTLGLAHEQDRRLGGDCRHHSRGSLPVAGKRHDPVLGQFQESAQRLSARQG